MPNLAGETPSIPASASTSPPGARGKTILLLTLLLLGMVYRLFAAYPMELGRFGPASSALQAMHILAGERPLFYSGQSWMGPAGAYLLAALYAVFGANTLTLGLFSWLMSVLMLALSVLLSYRLFGIDNALAVAALFLVPTGEVQYLAGQPRAHYEICYVLAPLIFLATIALLRRRQQGGRLPLPYLLLGLLSGFAFWTNMAIGPALAVSVLLLLAYLRRAFFTRVLPLWLPGFLIGVSPVIWYNLTHERILGAQLKLNAAHGSGRLANVLRGLATNAWPKFWGVDLDKAGNPALRLLLLLLLVWISALFAIGIFQGWKLRKRGGSVLGYHLVFGYFFIHLAVTSLSGYGQRFTGSTPVGYIIVLYTVAFTVPALVLDADWGRRTKVLALLPLGLFVANNLAATWSYPVLFFRTLRTEGLSRVQRYPDQKNPFLPYCRQRNLRTGYLGGGFGNDTARLLNFKINLECFGQVSFADPLSERYIENALAVDASRRLCWAKADADSLRTIGATSTVTSFGRWDIHDEFRKELRESAVIPARLATTAPQPPRASFASDGNFDTFWEPDKSAGDAGLIFAFDRPAKLREIVIFPFDAYRSPANLTVEVSSDGRSWRTALETNGGAPMFWSVFHPFIKLVKPRMELSLPTAEEVRFCRLRFSPDRNGTVAAVRELLFLGDGPVIQPADWEREIDEIIRAMRLAGQDAVVVGDHWFVDFFRREKFVTDYISNETINNEGQREPNLTFPVPLDFSRRQAFIVPRTHAPAVESLLRRRGVPARTTPFRFHALIFTEPVRVDPPLYWNGLTLNDLMSRPAGAPAARQAAAEFPGARRAIPEE